MRNMTGLEFIRYYNKYFDGISDRLTDREIDNMIEIMYESINDTEQKKIKEDKQKIIQASITILKKIDKQREEIEDMFVSHADRIAEKIMTDPNYSTDYFNDYPKLMAELKKRGL